jgi:hypothetical protein
VTRFGKSTAPVAPFASFASFAPFAPSVQLRRWIQAFLVLRKQAEMAWSPQRRPVRDQPQQVVMFVRAHRQLRRVVDGHRLSAPVPPMDFGHIEIGHDGDSYKETDHEDLWALIMPSIRSLPITNEK